MKKNTNSQRPKVVGVKAGRSSAGLGLFATKDFKKGERIIEYVGNRVPTGDEGPVNLYIFNVNKKIDIDGSPRWNTARYANHSCSPTFLNQYLLKIPEVLSR